MKTMTCLQLGGTCEEKIEAGSAEEMIGKGWAHLQAAHPDVAANITALPQEEKDKWMNEFKSSWDTKPEN